MTYSTKTLLVNKQYTNLHERNFDQNYFTQFRLQPAASDDNLLSLTEWHKSLLLRELCKDGFAEI